MGGSKVDCPLCLGEGVMPSFEECKEIVAGASLDKTEKVVEKVVEKVFENVKGTKDIVQKDSSCKPKNASTKKMQSEI